MSKRKKLFLAILVCLMVFASEAGFSQSSVLTNNANNARTGDYFEQTLNPSNVVAGGNFGKLHTWAVEGQIYAQPLYVHGLGGGTLNVVFVATEKNYVYAFDADPPFVKLWQVKLGNPVPTDDFGCPHPLQEPLVGITSTPVIDLNLNSIYVVAKSKVGGYYFHVLHKLDLQTGKEIKKALIFQGERALRHLNRPGLLLSNGMVYVAFGSHCDVGDYHGWVFAYDARTLEAAGEFNTTPSGHQGAIWQSGRGLVADPVGNIYFMTSNGDATSNSAGVRTNFGQSFVRLDPNLTNPDWWTVDNKDCYNDHDLDLGSSGPLLLTAPSGVLADNRIMGGSKVGNLYLFNAMNLGHDSPPMDIISATAPPLFEGVYCDAILYPGHTHHIHGGPVLWDRSVFGGDILIYNMGEENNLKAFLITNNRTAFLGPYARSKFRTPENSMPGGILSLSHSDSANSGLIWALHPVKDNAYYQIVEGMLSVFDATPTTCIGGDCTEEVLDLRLVWHSKLNSTRDDVGLFAKFAPATIADGKVFVPSFGDPNVTDAVQRPGWLHEYTLLPPPR